jgi:hypothetical protein
MKGCRRLKASAAGKRIGRMTLQTPDISKVASAMPGIIREAAKSLLGYASLVTILICGVACIFFKDSPDAVKIAIFVILIVAIALLFLALHSASSGQLIRPGPLLQPNPSPIRDSKGRFVPAASRDGSQQLQETTRP